MKKTCALFLMVGSAAASVSAQSSLNEIVLTYAGAIGATNSTVADTSVYTFNSLTNNTQLSNVVWTNVGTFSDLYVSKANEYGGAAGSQYAETSGKTGLGDTPSVTLTFNTPISYFGMWWSAGDANNFLSFYDGSTLVASFSTATLLSRLPSGYFGNPTPGYVGQDSAEAFAFINFFGQAGTAFTSIVISDPSTTSGFESDNWTIRTAAYGSDTNDTNPTLPGVPVEEIESINGVQTVVTNTSMINTTPTPAPEPGTASLLGLAGLAALWRAAKNRK